MSSTCLKTVLVTELKMLAHKSSCYNQKSAVKSVIIGSCLFFLRNVPYLAVACDQVVKAFPCETNEGQFLPEQGSSKQDGTRDQSPVIASVSTFH